MIWPLKKFGEIGAMVVGEKASLIERCYTLDHIPGKTIVKSLGLIRCSIKGIGGSIHRNSNDIFEKLLKAAEERGANAVVNVRLESGSYMVINYHVTGYLVAYGDAVVFE